MDSMDRECRVDVVLFEAANVWWMFSILELKKVTKLSHCVTHKANY